MVAVRSINQQWWTQLSQQRETAFTIHTLFDHAINLQDEQGALYTLLSRGLPNSAATAIVEIDDFSQVKATHARHDKIFFKERCFQFRSFSIDITEATQFWQASLPILDRSLTLEELALFKDLLPSYDRENKVESYIYQQIEQNGERLIAGIETEDDALIMQACRANIGLGLGLTPSGDDFLVGFLFGLSLKKTRYRNVIDIIRRVIDESRENTQAISWWMLHYAGEGAFNEWFIQYGMALVNNEIAEERSSLVNIRSIGSSSGSDMLLGLYLALRL